LIVADGITLSSGLESNTPIVQDRGRIVVYDATYLEPDRNGDASAAADAVYSGALPPEHHRGLIARGELDHGRDNTAHHPALGNDVSDHP